MTRFRIGLFAGAALLFMGAMLCSVTDVPGVAVTALFMLSILSLDVGLLLGVVANRNKGWLSLGNVLRLAFLIGTISAVIKNFSELFA